MEAAARHLAFHGGIVLLIGLARGAPYARAINRSAAPAVVNAWRVAHGALPIAAILMFAVAGMLSAFTTTAAVKWFVGGALIVSSYAFCLSLPLAAIVGHVGFPGTDRLSPSLCLPPTPSELGPPPQQFLR